MRVATATVVLALTVFVCWGIGTFVRRKAGAQGGSWPVSVAVGLAVMLGCGGLLNAVRLATAPALWALVLAGVVIGVLELRRARLPKIPDRRGRIEFLAAALVIAAATLFVIITQLPPSAFNWHDDLQKYFAHPVRMLATGTLLGSPLDGLGIQTLGGFPFLQGVVLSVFPIPYINAVDAVFGFFLLMSLAAAAGWRRFGRLPGALIGPLLVAAINPQVVNVAGPYLPAALMAAAVMLVADEREVFPPSPVLLGLLYAALIALKPTLGLFGALHLPLAFLAVRSGTGDWRAARRWAVRVGVWTVVGTIPWLATHLPNYLAQGRQWETPSPLWPDLPLDLLSTDQMFNGDSFAHYTGIVGLAVLVGGCAVISRRTATGCPTRRTWGVVAASGVAVLSYLILIVWFGKVVGYDAGLRYSIPTILGCAVVVLLLHPELTVRLPGGVAFGLPVPVCLAVILAAFSPSLVARCRQAVNSGHGLAFARLGQSPDYLDYNRHCLSPAVAEQVRRFQEQVPAGEPLFAWINTPFLLDYRRNPIVDAEGGGLLSPWARLPAEVTYGLLQLRGYRGQGTRHLAYYEYRTECTSKGDALTSLRAVAFLRELEQRIAAGEILARDEELMLVRFRRGAAP